MGVILDDSIEKEFDQLEAKGAFSLADQFRKAHEISLESLAFMFFIPARYQALVANSPANQSVVRQHDEKAKQEQDRKHAAELAAFRQQQIDQNVLRFSVDGQDIQISQGDLRKVMQHRVEELEEQKKELLKNGGDPKELRHIDNLLDEYQPTIDDLNNHKADAATMNTVHDLMERDPVLLQETKAAQHTADSSLTMNATTPMHVAVVGADATAAASLKNTFAQSTATVTFPPPSTASVPVEKPKSPANSAFTSLNC